MSTYKSRAELMNELVSMCATGVTLNSALEELIDTYKLSSSEISGYKNSYLFLYPYSSVYYPCT